MNQELNEREWLEWLWEGRGELYGCLPPVSAGESAFQGERPEVESASE